MRVTTAALHGFPGFPGCPGCPGFCLVWLLSCLRQRHLQLWAHSSSALLDFITDFVIFFPRVPVPMTTLLLMLYGSI